MTTFDLFSSVSLKHYKWQLISDFHESCRFRFCLAEKSVRNRKFSCVIGQCVKLNRPQGHEFKCFKVYQLLCFTYWF